MICHDCDLKKAIRESLMHDRNEQKKRLHSQKHTENDLSKASVSIKKALQVKRLSPIIDRFKLITLMKLQKMEYKK